MEKKINNNIRRGGQTIFKVFSFAQKLPTSNFQLPTSTKKGIATLPAVMVFGIMALLVAVSVTSLSFTELFISQGSGQSSRAHFYAESGARDALIKIARDKNYTYIIGEGYEIDFSASGCLLLNDCAKVLVVGDAISKIVTSKGIMKSSNRTLQVAVTLDPNGAITDTVWSEVVN